jgi:SAM-dependent methyltransferase
MSGSFHHPSDISPEDLAIALAQAERPDLLLQLVDLARHSFGLFYAHFPDTIKHPWIVAQLEHLPAGARILDVGSGVTPMPLFLADRGMTVDCIDNSPIIRTLPAGEDWDPWGFFDYRQLRTNLVSHHCDLADFVPPAPYDAIYASGVVAAMTSETRRETIRLCARWLRPSGIFLVSIGLVPGTERLWNLARGTVVEPPQEHGTVADMMREVVASGFDIVEHHILRGLRKAPADLVFARCSLARPPS